MKIRLLRILCVSIIGLFLCSIISQILHLSLFYMLIGYSLGQAMFEISEKDE